jgi:hypothetical protein
MKYFIDTEFLEGTQKEKFPISLFRKNTPNTIDLISIGIVSEDGREYYAISKDFNLKEAWNRFQLETQSGDMRNIFPEGKKVYWIRENVLKSIFLELKEKEAYENTSKYKPYFDNSLIKEMINKIWELNKPIDNYNQLKKLLNKYGKTNKQIAEEVKEFCTVNENKNNGILEQVASFKDTINRTVEFYAYYADYDWVVFCWLFGRMLDLPNGFPKYCIDLKQTLDDKASSSLKIWKRVDVSKSDFDMISPIKSFANYPKQDPSKAHNAIEDARWNKQLYEFLNTI